MFKYIFTLVCKQTYKIIWYLAWATMAVDCSGSNTVSTIHSHVRCLGIRSYLMGSVYELWDAIWTTNKCSSSGSSHKIWTTSTQATLYWNDARKRTGNLWVIRIKYKYQVTHTTMIRQLVKARFLKIQAVYNMMLQCWNEHSSERPSFETLQMDLDEFGPT